MTTYNIGTKIEQKGGFRAFIPSYYPPKGGFKFSPSLLKKNDEATRLLGKLDGITKLLPDADFFLLMYLRKDAASSSQIEGTMATMVDAIEAEAKITQNIPEDVDDILHYIKALNFGIKRVIVDDFPISLRFVRELHKELMSQARATHFSDPGVFRKTQIWIGGTRPDNAVFVPPPVEDMKRSLDELEKFIYKNDSIPVVIKSGLIHSQFETIHPFLDGNGRIGRLLITLYLVSSGILDKPLLYLSDFFEKNKTLYYDNLTLVRTKNDLGQWIKFFLTGIIECFARAFVM